MHADGAADPRDNFENILAEFNEHFIPKRNLINERAKFYSRNQDVGESVEEYVKAMCQMSEHAEFGNRDDNIRDSLVLGSKNFPRGFSWKPLSFSRRR